MPELPEVETVVRTLEKQIKGKRIVNIEVLYKNIVEDNLSVFKKKLIGQSFNEFKRRGKYILFEMNDITLVSHLRMEGKYYILNKDEPIDKHTHVIFYLNDGKQLRYVDVRKFGRMFLIDKGDYKNFRDLGPEPFDKSLNLEYCKGYLKNKKIPIKQILLEQSFIAGIGNIYADEILYASHIDPKRKGNRIKNNEVIDIIKNTRIILSKAIKKGGTTIRSYTSSLGVTGRFQLSLKCHTKQICGRCNSPIKKIKIAGRGTYYCPICQK